MDALTIQWGWFGGNPVSGPTPPTPPTPVDDGDAAYLPSFSRRDLDTAEERYHWRRKADPWALIRRWLPRPVDQFGPAAPDPEMQRRQWTQVARVVRIARLTRRR